MTDATTHRPLPDDPDTRGHDPDGHDPARAEGLGVLSLSTASEAQPEFDPAAALVAAATAEDGSVEEIVLLRLLVLRRAHPDAIVRTHLERVEDGQVVLRAEVTLPTGASASAYATAGGGVASIERTEQRALGRALDALGEAVLVDLSRKGDESLASAPDAIGHAAPGETAVLPDLDAWDDADDEEPALPSPEEEIAPPREIPPARFSPAPTRGRANTRPEPEPEPEPEARHPEPARTTAPPPAVVDAVRRANLRRHAAGPQPAEPGEPDASQVADPWDTPSAHDGPEASEVAGAVDARPTSSRHAVETSADEPPLENYSWTAFWRVARPLGLDKMKVEQIIGTPITSLTPLQVRERLQAEGVDI